MTKEEFDKLYSNDISKKEYDRIISLIDQRSSDVVMLIWPKICDDGWFVYANYSYEDKESEGYFDINEYKKEICYGGDFKFPEPYCFTDEGLGYIPTRWLWTDDEEILKEFNTNVKKAEQSKSKKKQEAKQKREELKVRKAKFKEIIKSKLSEEELKYINFK